jgi:NADH-quinone oxidoreductase subunit N
MAPLESLPWLAMKLPEGLSPNLHVLLPEFIVAGTALAAILPELVLPPARRAAATAWTSLAGLLVAFVVVVAMGPQSEQALHVVDHGMSVTGWHADAFAVLCRALITGGGALLVLLAMPFTRRMDRGHGEFYALLLFALLGVMLVSGVTDLLSMFVCLELVTIMAYILAALRRNNLESTEAGLKYLVIGAVSTALLLLGIGLLYGATGSISFQGIARVVATSGNSSALLLMGTALVLTGLFFKVGGVPFHVWIPDVYEGAPSPVTAFLITASKAAGVILLVRFAQVAFLPALATGHEGPWVLLLGTVAAITLVFGVLAALPQRGIKRMLAYSSIGHAGYLIMGIAAIAAAGGHGVDFAVEALAYYLMAYFVTSLTAFGVIVTVGGLQGDDPHANYAGLHKRSPFLALAMLLALLSLAGVPPMAGFFAKFLVLRALVDKGLYPLAFLGVAAVIVSLYFYLGWVRRLYFLDPPEDAPGGERLHVPGTTRVLLWVGMLGMLLMGVWMRPFFVWAHDAAGSIASVLGK